VPVTFNLADLFERVARRVPDREAVVCGERRLTYRQLDERAERTAAALAGAGVRAGDRVALALRNSTEYLEAMLGAFKLSAIPVNVNYRYQLDELRHVLADSGARLILHEADLTDRIAALRPDLPDLGAAISHGDQHREWLEAAPPRAPRRAGRATTATSSTPAAPPAIRRAWSGGTRTSSSQPWVAAAATAIRSPIPTRSPTTSPTCRTACCRRRPSCTAPAHWFAFLTLFGGNTVVLSADNTFDPARLLDLVDAESVSYVVLVGDAFATPLVDTIEATPQRWDLTSLTVVISGGATLSAPTRRALLDHLPWVIVVDSYGTSETGGQGSHVFSSGMTTPDGPPRFEPRDHTTVLGDDLRPIAPGSGAVGRVARRGHIPLGYLDDPQRTAATFPTVDGVRWALTGDQATVAGDGTLILLGRGSATINSGGEKIHPEEIEAVLRDHPAVHDAVVVGVPDERWGERVAAVVALRAERSTSAQELADHCRTRLADFKTPRDVAMVDHIRRSESGKPDYRWARAVATRRGGRGHLRSPS
jgi:3-oxocholest-4-en-26-oate---CoA ligase